MTREPYALNHRQDLALLLQRRSDEQRQDPEHDRERVRRDDRRRARRARGARIQCHFWAGVQGDLARGLHGARVERPV